jgi:hypothetical protein
MRHPLAVLLLAVLAGTSSAVPAGGPAALEALALCRASERLEGAARREALERGLALAIAAVAADDQDAAAHFAMFCTRGALGELDTAVRLAPDDPDVLAAKGAALLSLANDC